MATCKDIGSTKSERGREILEKGLWSDCEFLVECEGERRVFKAHRAFLARASSVFEDMFFNNSSGEIMPIPGIRPDVFHSMLLYIYTDITDFKCVRKGIQLCYCAHHFDISELEESCFAFLTNHVKKENVWPLLQLARFMNNDALQEECLKIVTEQSSEVLKTSDLGDVDLGTLELVLDQNHLAVTSELEVFEALLRWSSKECQRRRLETTGEMQRMLMNSSIKKIRFLTLTANEFAGSPVCSGVLTNEEISAIFRTHSEKDSQSLVPKSLCSLTNPRQYVATDGDKKVVGFRSRKVSSVDEHSGKVVNLQLAEKPDKYFFNKSPHTRTYSFRCNQACCLLHIVISTRSMNKVEMVRKFPSFDDTSIYEEDIEVSVRILNGVSIIEKSGKIHRKRVKWDDVVAIDVGPVNIAKGASIRIDVLLNIIGWYPIAEKFESNFPFKCTVSNSGPIRGFRYLDE